MAFPLIPLIGAGASIIQSMLAARSARRNTDLTNRGNRELADVAYSRDLEMMNKSNQYNREMWDLGNQYNAPQGQMARLQSAGLNPHLVYGSGAVGNSSGPPPRSEVARYNAPTAQYNYQPAVDLPGMLSMYQDFSVNQAQIDNLKAQAENTRARTANESIQSGLLRLKGQTGEFDLQRMRNLAPFQLDVERARAQGEPIRNVKLAQEIMNLRQDEQLKILQRQRGAKELTQMDMFREKLEADTLFSQYRNQWMKMGVTSSDSPLMRIFVRMLNESGLGSLSDLFEKRNSNIKNDQIWEKYKLKPRGATTKY